MATFLIKADLSIEELRSRIGEANILPVSRLAIVEHIGEAPTLCKHEDAGHFTQVVELPFYSFADGDTFDQCPLCMETGPDVRGDGILVCRKCGGQFDLGNARFLKGDKKQ